MMSVVLCCNLTCVKCNTRSLSADMQQRTRWILFKRCIMTRTRSLFSIFFRSLLLLVHRSRRAADCVASAKQCRLTCDLKKKKKKRKWAFIHWHKERRGLRGTLNAPVRRSVVASGQNKPCRSVLLTQRWDCDI